VTGSEDDREEVPTMRTASYKLNLDRAQPQSAS
jgi:hypothetical protein